MALDSQQSALLLQTQGRSRSCASRIYYAAYQAVTAVLLYRGCVPPVGREAWSHEVTPQLIVEQWEPLIRSLDRRRELERSLRRLYDLRVSADYVGNDPIEPSAVVKGLRDGNYLIKIANELLPGD